MLRILFITPEPPTPVGGGSQRMYYIIKYLSFLEIKIDLLTFVTKETKDRLEQLQEFCHTIDTVEMQKKSSDRFMNLIQFKAYRFYPAFQKRVLEKLKENKYDLVHVEKFLMAEYAFDLKNVPVVVDLWACGLKGVWCEVIYAKTIINKIINLSRLFRTALSDRRYYGRFRNYITVSSEAKDFISRRYPGKKVCIAPQGVILEETSSQRTYEENCIIFTGDMSFFPNVDAVLYFTREIYPQIKKEIPEIKFYIVGTRPDESVLQLAKEDSTIEVTGFVEDIREYLNKIQVYVVPLRSGSGVRTKILEAFSCHNAVVSTSQALEGIAAENRKEVLIADAPHDFAKSVVELLRNHTLRDSLSENGYRLVENKYTWKKIGEDIKNGYENFIGG